MAKHQKHASAKAGMLPGSVVYIGANAPEESRVIVHIYDNKSYRTIAGFDHKTIQKELNKGKHIWVDVTGLRNDQEISTLCQQLHFHPLVIEDVLHTGQRPKLEVFDDYLFVVLKLLNKPKKHLTYQTEQFCLLVKKNLLMTFRETNLHDFTPLYHRLSAELSLIREHGSDYLTYLVMDRIVDDYFNFVENVGDMLEKMENLLVIDPEKISLEELYTIKKRTLTLRKIIAPLCDIIHLLLKEQRGFFAEKYHIYYRDLHDHSLRLLEATNLHHETTASMLDIYLSTLNNRMNATMKILTLFASIFIPLSFLVGVYGMNFEFMPELRWRYAYPTLLGIMVLIVIVMLYYFKRKKLI